MYGTRIVPRALSRYSSLLLFLELCLDILLSDMNCLIKFTINVKVILECSVYDGIEANDLQSFIDWHMKRSACTVEDNTCVQEWVTRKPR